MAGAAIELLCRRAEKDGETGENTKSGDTYVCYVNALLTFFNCLSTMRPW